MTPASDIEMVRRCAEAMGIHLVEQTDARLPAWAYKKWPDPDENGGIYDYNPLTDDAQAMALVKKLKLHLLWISEEDAARTDHAKHLGNLWSVNMGQARNADLNRAIVECVSNLHSEKMRG